MNLNTIIEWGSSSTNIFQCGIYYRSDGCLGRENRFYSIGVLWWRKEKKKKKNKCNMCVMMIEI